MGFLQRIFSSDYRKALAAEAQGDFVTAARHYALAGHGDKVADMHLAQARVEATLEQRVRALRSALSFTARGDSRRPMVLRLLGRALQERATADPLSSEERRQTLLEAAELFEESEGWQPAGDCYVAAGERQRAAAAYSRGGLVERVEEVLSAVEQDQDRARREDSLFRDYELLLQGGQRDAAAEALRGCVEAAQQKGEYRRLLADVEARLLVDARVELEVQGRRVLLVGRFPLVLGREGDCDLALRGNSVSRRHTRLLHDVARGFLVEDCGSRNGTLLNGLRLGAVLSLPAPSGTIDLGESCQLEYTLLDAASPAPPLLQLRVARGLDEGRTVVASPGPVALPRVLGDDAPAVEISFARGRPLARATAGRLQLNGALVSDAVQLLRGDALRLDGREARVLA